MLKIAFSLIIFCIISSCLGQLLIKNDGPCNCDLTTDACDINCCCDSKCTKAQIATFSCDNDFIKPAGLSCFPKALLFRNNTRFDVKIDGEKFCIYNDNYTNRNFYYKPTELKSTDILKSSTDNLPRFAFTISISSIKKSSYQVGDTIYTFIPDKFIGQLLISAQTSQGSCNRNSFVLYGKPINIRCNFTPPPSSCSQMPHIKDYYPSNELVVLTNPSVLFQNINSTNLPNSSYVPITCAGDCMLKDSTPTGDNCDNVVTNVHYSIRISNSKIINIDLVINTSSVLRKKSFEQSFKADFTSVNILNDAGSSTIGTSVALSGNPGYLDGHSVRIVLESERSKTTDYSVNEKLSLLNSGECKSDNLLTVGFGSNVNSECYITVDTSSNLTDLINTVLNPILPAFIGPFGNTVTGTKSNLVSVLTRNINADSPTRPITNLNITGYNIDIVYARNGTLTKPQNKIIGVRLTYLYSTSKIISSRMWVTNSVNFYDNSQTQFSLDQSVQKLKSHRSVREFFYLLYAETNFAKFWRINYPIIVASLMVYFIFFITHFI